MNVSFNLKCLVMHNFFAHCTYAKVISWENTAKLELKNKFCIKIVLYIDYHKKAIIIWQSVMFCMQEVYFYNKNWTKWKIEMW